MTAAHPPRPRRHRRTLVGILALLLLAAGASAAEHARPDFSGDWRFVGGRAEKRDVRSAIDRSVGDMTLVLRGVARSRLLRGSKIPKRISIENNALEVAIRDGERLRLASPLGRVTQTVSSTGDPIELLYEFRDGALVQYRSTPEGGRRTTYRINPTGSRLLIEVVTSSHYLPSPVTYRLSYERVGAAANTPAH